MPWRTVVDGIGRVLVAGGVLILLFVVYQLWGTGITESQNQARLRHTFQHELAAVHPAGSNPTATSTPTTSTTTPLPDIPVPNIAAPAEGNPVGVIRIPTIGLDQVVVEGTNTADLRLGPGHYPGTPLPGEAGNVAIAGHRTTYQHPFYNLNQLVDGDDITITTLQGIFTYQVFQTLVVSPSDTSVADPTPTAELTLTTCTPVFSASHRLVVHAKLASVSATTSVTTPTTTTTTSTPPTPHITTLADDAAGGGDWVPALWWGLADLLVASVVWLFARRARGAAVRWAVYGVGALAVLGVLFYFFSALSPLVPASL